jgi:NADH-quinone oxidoreductase subunit N
MNLGNLESLGYIVPELLLLATILTVFIADLLVRRKERVGEIALLGTAASAFAISALSGGAEGWLFSKMIVQDPFATFFKVVFALATLATVWMSLGSKEIQGTNQAEYYGLLLSSTLGMYFMASAANLLMAYLALEFVSLTSYVLTGYLRHDRRGGEAALKYLIYGGVASGAMIYGMSWIYGLTGSMDFAAINAALTTGEANKLAVFIAALLTLVGFGYKITAVPFHMWAPDVYTGAPIPIAAFLSVGSKAAGFSLLIRFFYPAMSQLEPDGTWQFIPGVDWPQVVLVLSMVTMTLGNLAALSQNNLKRMLAYSSIAHAGYMLMGFVVLSNEGLRAVMFYLVVYYLMNIGAFLVGHRYGHLPVLAHGPAAVRRLHRQALSVCRGRASGILRPRRGRRPQQRRLAVLLRARRAHDVPRLPRRLRRFRFCHSPRRRAHVGPFGRHPRSWRVLGAGHRHRRPFHSLFPRLARRQRCVFAAASRAGRCVSRLP